MCVCEQTDFAVLMSLICDIVHTHMDTHPCTLHAHQHIYINARIINIQFHRPIEYKDLPSLLSTRMGMRSFAYYLASEFQVERLLFFFAVQKYKNSCTHLMRLRSFSELYSQFVPINAPKDLLLPSTVQDHLSMEVCVHMLVGIGRLCVYSCALVGMRV